MKPQPGCRILAFINARVRRTGKQRKKPDDNASPPVLHAILEETKAIWGADSPVKKLFTTLAPDTTKSIHPQFYVEEVGRHLF